MITVKFLERSANCWSLWSGWVGRFSRKTVPQRFYLVADRQTYRLNAWQIELTQILQLLSVVTYAFLRPMQVYFHALKFFLETADLKLQNRVRMQDAWGISGKNIAVKHRFQPVAIQFYSLVLSSNDSIYTNLFTVLWKVIHVEL
jgi:hypothetical protein